MRDGSSWRVEEGNSVPNLPGAGDCIRRVERRRWEGSRWSDDTLLLYGDHSEGAVAGLWARADLIFSLHWY